MRWPARFRGDEGGFTLVELIIGIAITGIIMSAIGSAIFVALSTTDVTNKRMSESHDVQITSAYLANDVQSAYNVAPAPSSACATAGPPTPVITFAYKPSGNPAAQYACGRASNGETQVTRTFNGATVVLAHFADTAQPAVTCTPNADCSGTVGSVKLIFTEASGLTYTLLGSRRLYNAAPGGPTGGGGGAPPLTLLASGSSPLWVLGACKGGSSSDCISSSTNSLPVSDVANPSNAWKACTTTPPTTSCVVDFLWSKLNDGLNSTFVRNDFGSNKEGKVAMGGVTAAPAAGTFPTIRVWANAVCQSACTNQDKNVKLTVTLYNGAKSASDPIAIDPTQFTVPTEFTWTLKQGDMNQLGGISSSDYINGNLSIGFSMTSGTNNEDIQLYELALEPDYGSPVLTVNGGLLVDSTLANAVRLSGTKNFKKLYIVGGVFQILKDGKCSGCATTTVQCDLLYPCPGGQPGSFDKPIPDPLRFMAAPTGVGVSSSSSCPGTGWTNYQAGIYTSTLQLQNKSCLGGGIYILKAGMIVNGNAQVVGQNVMFFNAGGSTAGAITINGGASVNLTAYGADPYKGILIFQARCTGDDPVGCASNQYNTKAMSLSGGASIGQPSCTDANHSSLLGIIYAPASTGVTLGTGGANMCVGAVIARNVTVTGNSQVTIGANS